MRRRQPKILQQLQNGRQCPHPWDGGTVVDGMLFHEYWCIFLVADTRLYTLPCWSVGPSVHLSFRHIFEFRAVFALLLLPNCPRLDCRVSGLVFLRWPNFPSRALMTSACAGNPSSHVLRSKNHMAFHSRLTRRKHNAAYQRGSLGRVQRCVFVVIGPFEGCHYDIMELPTTFHFLYQFVLHNAKSFHFWTLIQTKKRHLRWRWHSQMTVVAVDCHHCQWNRCREVRRMSKRWVDFKIVEIYLRPTCL